MPCSSASLPARGTKPQCPPSDRDKPFSGSPDETDYFMAVSCVAFFPDPRGYLTSWIELADEAYSTNTILEVESDAALVRFAPCARNEPQFPSSDRDKPLTGSPDETDYFMAVSCVAFFLDPRGYLTSLIELADEAYSTKTILEVESDAVLGLLCKPARGTNPNVLLRNRGLTTPPRLTPP
jgi:hypothetical protein